MKPLAQIKQLILQFRKNDFMNLHNIRRWDSIKLISPETDAEHTFTLQAMILQLGEMVQARDRNWDIKDACFRALLHDMDEACSGDIVKHLKYHSQVLADEFHKAQSELMRDSWQEETCQLIDNSKGDDTPEAQLVAFFDVYGGFSKMRQEVLMGNRFMGDKLFETPGYMDQIHTDKVDPATQAVLDALRVDLAQFCKQWARKIEEF